MDLAKPKAAMARLVLLDSAAAEVAFFLALSLVPFVGIAIALVSRWFPVGLSASIGKVLRDVLPAESPVAGEVLRWARSSASKGWLTVGFLLALWSSFRFMSLCIRALGTMISGDVRPSAWTWRSAARSLLLLAVWIVALVATALFLLVAPSIRAWTARASRAVGPFVLGLFGAAGAPRPGHSVRRNLPDLPRGRRHAGRLVPGGAGRAAGLTGLDRRQPGVLPRRPVAVERRAALRHARQRGAVPDLGLPHRLDPPARRTPAGAARLGASLQLAGRDRTSSSSASTGRVFVGATAFIGTRSEPPPLGGRDSASRPV